MVSDTTLTGGFKALADKGARAKRDLDFDRHLGDNGLNTSTSFYVDPDKQGVDPKNQRQSDQLNLLRILESIYREIELQEDCDDDRKQFFSGMAKEISRVTEDEILRHPVFLSAHPEFVSQRFSQQPIIFSQHSGRTGSSSTVLSSPIHQEAALRAAVSIGVERYTENAIDRGVKYGFGVKDGKSSIDCSGFVAQAVKNIAGGKDFSDANLSNLFSTHSDGQIADLARKTNFMLQGDQVNLSNIKAGMIIGIDSGNKGWDAGRKLGVDHIGIVFADSETGKLMFAESRGGKGVMKTELSEWLKMAEKKDYKLFAADVVRLASEDYKQRLDKSIQTSLPQATQGNLGDLTKSLTLGSSSVKPLG